MADERVVPTCPGHCCAVLAFGREDVEDLARDPDDPEGLQLAAMLVPLTHRQAVARSRRFGSPAVIRAEPKGPGSRWFACRHWDERTRLCRIYEDRPSTCRDFPYDEPCRHGCGHVPPPSVVAEWAAWRREAAREVACPSVATAAAKNTP